MSIHPIPPQLPTELASASTPGQRQRKASVTLLRDIALQRGRAHEACGSARYSLALWLAGAMAGPVLWISPPRDAAELNPDGMVDFADPSRFLWVTAPRSEDVLWTMEEALRSGATPLVIADLPAPPAITPVRRLHMAAAAGGPLAMDGNAPLALLLTPGAGGAQGIESRWTMRPAHQYRNRIWQLDRLRARALPPRSWQLTQRAPGGPLTETVAPDTSTPSPGQEQGQSRATHPMEEAGKQIKKVS